MKCMLYDWDELYERADGSACGDPELNAKDEARNWLEGFLEEDGIELEWLESVEEEIDSWLARQSFVPMFNEDGSWVCNIDKGRLWCIN